MGIIVLVAFIFALSRLWSAQGAGTPIKFIIAWVLGLLGFSALGLAPAFFRPTKPCSQSWHGLLPKPEPKGATTGRPFGVHSMGKYLHAI